MEGSPPGQLSGTDWRKIAKGLGIAMAGSGVAYIGQEVIPGLESAGMGWLAPFGGGAGEYAV